MALYVAGSAILAIIGFGIYLLLFVGRRGRYLPPGNVEAPSLDVGELQHLIDWVQGLPHFRSLEMLTKFHRKEYISEWAKEYGGIYSVKFGPGTAIVLTDRRLVKELLDKKSSIFSGRPTSYVSGDIITSGDHLLVMDYGPKWRELRKLVHQDFAESVCEREYVKIQEAEAVQMLRDFVNAPEHYMLHPKRFSNSVVMSILFGARTPSYTTPHMTRLYELLENWSEVMEIGATPPVDFFPFLKWVPERFLGHWVSRATKVKREMDSLYGDVVRSVIKRREEKGSKGSFMDKVLDKQGKLNLSPHQLYFLGGVAMEGGSDTSSSCILSFLKAMTCYPEVQKRAQAEIDAVMDQYRSPQWSDYSKLPYVSQVVKEAMRWRPVGPLGFPHALTEGKSIHGMFLPKGSIVILNIWGLHNDESRFPNPDKFDPDRYAGRTLLAPEYAVSADYESRDHYMYGTGRRLCPGIHLAERNLFLGMSKLLWAFSFEKEVDANGRVMEPDQSYETGYSEGFLVCTKPFPCKIIPRSQKRVETIMKEFEQAGVEVFSKFD
ncbi:uncharacterized protein Z518_08095 [Rhinocladiella mackenziei CBS 650.93]|uniref:Rhinocladiella mackenziei CBS 650.93 unplaced genomic scaffold supercont1.6, whole genome shotgun sequence n=1 Tax=Rhinocladiella mackenziei CBS 650.93 TaxID=1442369 RepID=A0A0D2IFW3_9EURO|nr:uncharacterized protein Z518_08095 [Rhinocladiella mackenziei CBS 650.93]KIX02156.1 hypothetical protein Z518_08095 [Rhinocladiella mackenziei CBS 650.93]